MSKKIKISPEYYPSDFDLFSLIMHQGISRTSMAHVLKSKGIFCNSNLSSDLAEVYCSLIHDDPSLQKLLQFANVRENRTKASQSELIVSGVTLDEIQEALQTNLYEEIPPDSKIKLSDKISRPMFDKANKEINLSQGFIKVDYGKTKLLQETNHEFTLNIKPGKDVGKYEFQLKTSSIEGEEFVNQIKVKILKKFSDKKASFSNIKIEDIQSDKINDFFDYILKEKLLDFRFQSADQIKLQNPKFNVLEESFEKNSEDKDFSIKTLTVSGTNLLEMTEVKRWRSNGYYIRSLRAEYSKYESSESDVHYLILLEFSRFGSFHCEIEKSWIKTKDGIERAQAIDSWIRDELQSAVNNIALKQFEKVKKAEK